MPRRTGSQRLEARKARLERHANETNPGTVLDAAARFLETRSRSIEELRRHLVGAAFPPPLIEQAIARLVELGMLDDRAFAAAWVESRDRSRPRGQTALRRELALKGVDRDTAESVLADRTVAALDGGPVGSEYGDRGRFGDRAASADEAAAERLLRKGRGALLRVEDPRARRRRAYAILARNGFDPEVCREVSVRFLSEDAEPDD